MAMVPDLEALVREFGLEAEGRAVESLAQWSAQLEYSDGPLCWRLGGSPDLPPSASWPLQSERHPDPGDPFLFVGQLALGDLAGLDVWPGPSKGLLSFFCASHPERSGYVPDEDSAMVLFTETLEGAERRAAPPSRAPISLEENSIEVSGLESTLPGPEAPALKQLGLWWDQDRGERYGELYDRWDALRPARPRHRVLGHADPVQSDVMLNAAHLAGRSVHRSLHDDERTSLDWRLPLQVDCDDDRLGAEWGDGGTLYFCVPAADLPRARFDRVQAVTQSGYSARGPYDRTMTACVYTA